MDIGLIALARTITTAMLLHLGTAALLFSAGMSWVPLPGIYYAVLTLVVAMLCKTVFLARCVRDLN